MSGPPPRAAEGRDPRRVVLLLGSDWLGGRPGENGRSADGLVSELRRRGFTPQLARSTYDAREAVRESPVGSLVLDLLAPPAELYPTYDLAHSFEPALPCLLLGPASLASAFASGEALDSLDAFVEIGEAAVGEVAIGLTRLVKRAYPSEPSGLGEPEPAGLTEQNGLICVLSPKGGAGKTTIACNVAVALAAERGLSVALVDGDSRFGDVDLCLGLGGRLRGGGDETPDGAFERHPSGLSVLGAPLRPEGGAPSPVSLVRMVGVARRQHEQTIVDLPWSGSEEVAQLLEAATRVVVVIRPDAASIRGAALLLGEATKHGWAKKALLVLNGLDGTADGAGQFSPAAVEHRLGAPVVSVPHSDLARQSAAEGRTVVEAHPASPAAVGVRAVVEALVGEAAPARSNGLRRFLSGLPFGH